MKKLRFLYTIIISFTFILVGISCEGPTGSDGPQGAQGEQGAEGPQGEQGEPGTANVIYSDWMNVTWNYSDETTYKQMYIKEPRVVDEDFLASGTLLMYFKIETLAGLAISPFPYTAGNDHLRFLIGNIPSENVEGIVVQLMAIDGSTAVQTDWDDYQFRYVMIPGGVPAKMKADFIKDYEAVKEYYGITN